MEETNYGIPMNRQTKECKYCKMYIPEEAKICPFCRKKQKEKKTFISILLFIIFIYGLARIFFGQLEIIYNSSFNTHAARNDAKYCTINRYVDFEKDDYNHIL